MTFEMTVRREILVFVVLGALAWFVGLSAGMRMADLSPAPQQVKEHEPPPGYKFSIRRAA